MIKKLFAAAVVSAGIMMLAACSSKPAETTAAPTEAVAAAESGTNVFTGDSVNEIDGKTTPLAEGQTGWKEDRDAVSKSFETSGKKAPGDAYSRAKAEGVVNLVNSARSQHGLSALVMDEKLMAAAEMRAQEQQQSFSHTRPDGSDCFTVFDQYGIQAGAKGENVACGGACSAEAISGAWMNSPGHRDNILDPKFSRIGVGCYESGGYGYWAQEFAN